MENKNKKENIVNTSNEALNEPIKEDVEEVNLETSKDSKEKKERNKKILKYIFYFLGIIIITGVVLFFSLNGNTKAYNEETGVVEEMKVYEAIPGTFGRIFTKQNTIIFFPTSINILL